MKTVKAIFFDQDGVIIDTEKDGHRVAFNQAFAEFEFDVEWSVDAYKDLLQIAGGKERMRHYLHTTGFGRSVAPGDEDNLIRSLHKRKTEIFIELIQGGELPLRSGVKRVMREATVKGIAIGICTTANEQAAKAVVQNALSDIPLKFILAGDVVHKKKPDPEIYLLAIEKSGLLPEECVVIEDSRVGVTAAKAAGLSVVATTSTYTVNEDLSQADIIVSSLGDPDGEQGQLIYASGDITFDGVLGVEQMLEYFSDC